MAPSINVLYCIGIKEHGKLFVGGSPRVRQTLVVNGCSGVLAGLFILWEYALGKLV